MGRRQEGNRGENGYLQGRPGGRHGQGLDRARQAIVRLQAAEQDWSDRVERRNPTGPTRPAGRAGLRIAGLLEASPAFRFWTPRRLNGGCECPWVRNKGGGVGRKADAGGHSHPRALAPAPSHRSEEHTSELQSLMPISYAVFCLQKKKKH